MVIGKVCFIQCRHFYILAIRIDGNQFFYSRNIEQIGTRSGCRIVSVSWKIRCRHQASGNVYRSNFGTVKQHIVDHRVRVQCRTEDTGTETNNVFATLIYIPGKLETWLHLQGINFLIGTDT
ncbi:hypothetical protein D9M68_659730 [compost metagenome]